MTKLAASEPLSSLLAKRKKTNQKKKTYRSFQMHRSNEVEQQQLKAANGWSCSCRLLLFNFSRPSTLTVHQQFARQR